MYLRNFTCQLARVSKSDMIAWSVSLFGLLTSDPEYFNFVGLFRASYVIALEYHPISSSIASSMSVSCSLNLFFRRMIS